MTFFLLCLIFLGVVWGVSQRPRLMQWTARATHVVLLLPLLGHTTSQSEHEVEGRLLLDVVVREGAAVLELLAGKDEALLVGRDALLVLDLGLDLLRVRDESARELVMGVRGE